VDTGILLPLVPFGIFLAVPKAQCQDLIGFRVRYQKGLIHEPGLFLQNGQHFFVDGVGEFPAFPDLDVTSTVRVNMEKLLLRLF